MRTSTARRRIAAGLLTTVALAGSALVAEPASAATPTSVLYSTDGGTSWSSAAAVAPGATVLVRQWFDNTDNLHATAASVTTTLPAGFAQAGATQVCLNPSTTTLASPDNTELACATATNGAVWSGSNLTVSPTAGLFGQSAGDTSGILAAGRTRYLTLNQCRWTGTGNQRVHAIIDTSAFTTNTGAGNSVTGSSCATSVPGWSADGGINAAQAYGLFARRYVNLHQCRWRTGANNIQTWNASASSAGFSAATNTSNTIDSAVTCGAGTGAFPPETGPRGVVGLDILTGRYLNLQQCRYGDPGSDNRFSATTPTSGAGTMLAGTNAANTADGAPSCTTTVGWNLLASTTGVQAIDLLDTARGKGYVEYSMTAPATPSAAFCDALGTDPVTAEDVIQSTALTSSAGTTNANGTLSVDWALLADPCPGNVSPAVDLRVGLLLGGTMALAGAWVHRRRSAVAAV